MNGGISQLLSRGNNSQLAAGDRGLLSRIYVRRWRRRAAFGFILDRAWRFMRPIRLSLSVDLRAPFSSLAIILDKTLLPNFPPFCCGYRDLGLRHAGCAEVSNFCRFYLFVRIFRTFNRRSFFNIICIRYNLKLNKH